MENPARPALRNPRGARLRSGSAVLVACALAPLAALAQAEPPGRGSTAAPPVRETPAAAPGQNPFAGGIPTGTVSPEVLRLDLAGAISRALKSNLGAVLSGEAERAAEGTRSVARSALLPNVSGRLAGTRQVINLEAFGIPIVPPMTALVGPFNVLDQRVSAQMSLFNLGAIETARAGRLGLESARAAHQDARDTVVAQVAQLYLAAVAGASRIEAADAQLKTSTTLYERAVDLKRAGIVAGIEVLRAQVQRDADQQRLLFYQNEFAKQKLALARAIGLPLAQEFALADSVPYAALPQMPLAERLERAQATRPDLRAARFALDAAHAARKAALAEGLPSLGLAADYGRLGLTPDTLRNTYTISGALTIPLFLGGRVRGRLLEADARWREQQASFDDLRGRVEYEVRSLTLDLESSDRRVHVAQGALDLARQALVQAEDRFTAGVASNIEVVQAQEAVATATENLISSLYAFNLAKVGLARAMGVAESSAVQFLGGHS